MRGKLICLFGIDGSGKSSLLEILNEKPNPPAMLGRME